jgi:PAS domain S-box-containing protein
MQETTVDLHALVEAAGDAIIVADAAGCIVLWNPAAARRFGFAAAEAVGRSLDLIIPERFRERHWTGYRTVMATGQTRYGTQVLRVPALHKAGQRLSIAFTVALLHGPEGSLTGMAAIVRDDTARWQEEQALRQWLAALEGREASG